jgi:very-short-patch-repair endonuclease
VPLSDELAAILACGPGTYLSHGSAARLWGLPVPTSSRLVWVTVTHGSTSRTGIKVSRRRLGAADVTMRHGIPTVKPARALIDLAGSLSASDLERALAEARIKNLVRDRELEGNARIGAILRREHGPKVTRSEMERIVLLLLRGSRLPEPECNAKVHGHRADFLWRRQRLVVETDGWGFHNQHRHFEYDHRSTNHLKGHGYEVLRFTWSEVTRESSKVVALIAGCLG